MSIALFLSQFAWAADSSTAPVPPLVPTSTTPTTQTDVKQFQNWLNSNMQNPGALATQAPPRLVAPQQTAAAVTTATTTTAPKTATPAPVKKILNVPTTKKNPNTPVVNTPPLTYEQSQQIMLKSAPKSDPPSADSTAAFNSMMQQNMPLTPEQVVRLRQLIDTSQRAASIPATIPPKPVSSTLMVNLAPGATPPAIRLALGYVSSLVFVDSTGAPWPLASYDIGDPKATVIQWDGKSNILLIQAVTPYSDGNLVVRLVGLPTPITLELVSGQRVVDYRTDIHVSGVGPNAKDIPTGTGLPNSANQLLLNVLDGVAPPGSKQLQVTGGDCQAWLLGDKMYVRTRFTLLSPGWVGRMTSPDGMIAYEIPKTSSILISQYGNPIELKIEGF